MNNTTYMLQSTVSKSPRIEVVDALRGFAVLAILLVHNVEHFIYPVYPDPATLPGWLNVLNEGVFTVVFALFAGKSYSIFALLFGFTFYIQYSNQQAKGKDFGYRFLWRLLLLTIDLYFMMGKNARAMADINRVFVESTPTAALYVLRGKVKLAQYEKASAALDFKKAEDMGYDKTTIDELMKMAR